MGRKVEYDPEVIHELAARLYAQAHAIQVLYSLAGALVGGGVAGIATGEYPWAIAGGLAGALLGFAVAGSRAFALRVQAQTVLCQAEIEENTRGLRREAEHANERMP